ncbi:hypothetical protein HHK36_008687 [Tetracentron sinense]|uniref:DNA-directed RNA polymerase n=1 Tax=Tetracentron sinense TaxID=13715 RepID=A0A834ZFX6_TETSI|nr:hypothetical protein HHK36_008687 [Tetracentron sinense]
MDLLRIKMSLVVMRRTGSEILTDMIKGRARSWSEMAELLRGRCHQATAHQRRREWESELERGCWRNAADETVELLPPEKSMLVGEDDCYNRDATKLMTHVTSQGPERITSEIPHLEAHLLRNLDKNGIVMLGSWVEMGDILVGKLTPQMAKESSYAPEDRLLRAILGIQIFECSLGLAGGLLGRHYRIAPFDERHEQEASRKLVFPELYEASKQTTNPWVFEPKYPGKSRIFDGRTGDPFEQPVIIGKSYILKFINQVDDKIHGRSSGHYALVTQQPLRGRAKQGGQRVGEMEVWALEGFGVAHILQEMLTYKSDHIRARQEVLGTTIIGGTIPNPEDAPESF